MRLERSQRLPVEAHIALRRLESIACASRGTGQALQSPMQPREVGGGGGGRRLDLREQDDVCRCSTWWFAQEGDVPFVFRFRCRPGKACWRPQALRDEDATAF